jgi:hypothetical protein
MEAVLHRPQRGEIAGLRQAGRVSGKSPAKRGACSRFVDKRRRVSEGRKIDDAVYGGETKSASAADHSESAKGVFLQLQRLN